jgi:uncharacterized membrane protein YqhA
MRGQYKPKPIKQMGWSNKSKNEVISHSNKKSFKNYIIPVIIAIIIIYLIKKYFG